MGDESDIDVEVETERELVLYLSGSENDDTGPQTTVYREWSETLNDVTVEKFSSCTESVLNFGTISNPLEVFDHYFPLSLYGQKQIIYGLLHIEDVNKVCFG